MGFEQPSSLNLAFEMEFDVPDQQPSLGLPVKMKEHHSTGSAISTSQTSKMEPDAKAGSQPPQTHTTEMDLDTKPEFSLAIFSDSMKGKAYLGQDPSTTLAVRTTEDVIADLRRTSVRRPVDMDKLSSEGERNPNDSISNVVDEDGDSDLEDRLPVPKQRNITERKRRLNAIADSFMQKRNEKLIKVSDE
jgi:endoribonuclease Dicer